MKVAFTYVTMFHIPASSCQILTQKGGLEQYTYNLLKHYYYLVAVMKRQVCLQIKWAIIWQAQGLRIVPKIDQRTFP